MSPTHDMNTVSNENMALVFVAKTRINNGKRVCHILMTHPHE